MILEKILAKFFRFSRRHIFIAYIIAYYEMNKGHKINELVSVSFINFIIQNSLILQFWGAHAIFSARRGPGMHIRKFCWVACPKVSESIERMAKYLTKF